MRLPVAWGIVGVLVLNLLTGFDPHTYHNGTPTWSRVTWQNDIPFLPAPQLAQAIEAAFHEDGDSIRLQRGETVLSYVDSTGQWYGNDLVVTGIPPAFRAGDSWQIPAVPVADRLGVTAQVDGRRVLFSYTRRNALPPSLGPAEQYRALPPGIGELIEEQLFLSDQDYARAGRLTFQNREPSCPEDRGGLALLRARIADPYPILVRFECASASRPWHVFLADYHADGSVDRAAIYSHMDPAGVPRQVTVYYAEFTAEQPGLLVFRRDAGRGPLLHLTDYSYEQVYDQWQSGFRGNASFAMWVLDSEGEWRSVYESPFHFYGDDSTTSTAVRVTAEGQRLTSVRYSQDVDGDGGQAKPTDYDASITYVGDVPLPAQSGVRWLVGNNELPAVLSRAGARELSPGLGWDRALLTWDEDDWNYADRDRLRRERWEGAIGLRSPSFPWPVGGPPSTAFNTRYEIADPLPAGPGRVYLSSIDQRFHLFGARTGWLSLDLDRDDLPELIISYSDTDEDGYFDSWRYDLDGDGAPEHESSVKETPALVSFDHQYIGEQYQQVTRQRVADAYTLLTVLRQLTPPDPVPGETALAGLGATTTTRDLAASPETLRLHLEGIVYQRFRLFLGGLTDSVQEEQLGALFYSGRWSDLIQMLASRVAETELAPVGPTYTAEELATARSNLLTHSWAREELAEILLGNSPAFTGASPNKRSAALSYALRPDGWLWDLVPSTRLPRVYYVNQEKGSPQTGREIYRYHAHYPWRIDPVLHPYRVQDPVDGTWYPTNDFLTGDMTTGPYADNGAGWVSSSGDRYYFIAYYVHAVYLQEIFPAINSLALAYAVTGDPIFAHKAGVLLAKVATEYPNAGDRADRTFQPGYGQYSGMISDVNWGTDEAYVMARAFATVLPALRDDTQLAVFVGERVPGVRTTGDVVSVVAKSILLPAAQALQDRRLLGNDGMHQRTAAALSLALTAGGSEYRAEVQRILDWLFDDVGMRYWADNSFGIDGSPFSSPSYGVSRAYMLDAALLLERFRMLDPSLLPADRYPSLLDHPKFKQYFAFYAGIVSLDRYFPVLGDSRTGAGGASTYNNLAPLPTPALVTPSALGGAALFLRPYLLWRSPALGALLASTPEPARDLFLPGPDVGEATLEWRDQSLVLDGYGLAILRSGVGDNRRAVSLFYGDFWEHGHQDPLTIGLNAYSLDLLPELGYPQAWNHRGWESHIAAHDTMTVDGRQPTLNNPGALRFLADLPGVKAAQAQQKPYREVDLYQRTVVMVDVDEDSFYLLDAFDVMGGTAHTLSWHGPGNSSLLVEGGGTALPGPAPPLFDGGGPYPEWEDNLKERRLIEYGEPLEVRWLFRDAAATRLSLYLLPQGRERLVTGRGRPPADPAAYWLDFAFTTRQGDSRPLSSRFLTLLASYQGKPVVREVSRHDTALGTLVIVESDQRRDYLVIGQGDFPDTQVAAAGDVAWVQAKGKEVSRLGVIGRSVRYGNLGLELRDPGPWQVVEVDWRNMTVKVKGPEPVPGELAGEQFQFGNGWRSHTQTVRYVESLPDGGVLHLETLPLMAAGEAWDFHDNWFRTRAALHPANLEDPEADQDNYYRGAWVEGRAGTGYRVTGITPGRGGVIRLEDGVTTNELTVTIGGEYRVYAFGPGDTVSWKPRAELSRISDQRWRLEGAEAGAVATVHCTAQGSTTVEWSPRPGSPTHSLAADPETGCTVRVPPLQVQRKGD